MLGKPRAVLIGILLAATVVNIFQFRTIDASADGGYSALTRLSSTDIMKSATENPVIEQSYGLYLALADVSPGSNVVVSNSGIIPIPAFRDHMLGLGEVKSVRVAEYNEIANGLLNPEDTLDAPEKYHIAEMGTAALNGQMVPWQIVTGKCASAPEFAVMRMTVQDSNDLLLIETCLLPEGTVDEK